MITITINISTSPDEKVVITSDQKEDEIAKRSQSKGKLKEFDPYKTITPGIETLLLGGEHKPVVVEQLDCRKPKRKNGSGAKSKFFYWELMTKKMKEDIKFSTVLAEGTKAASMLDLDNAAREIMSLPPSHYPSSWEKKGRPPVKHFWIDYAQVLTTYFKECEQVEVRTRANMWLKTTLLHVIQQYASD